MRCLFCGKELALLKRLRGGGEFCSEAHRKEYQEQYEQLALARLLQAKPPAEPTAPLGPAVTTPAPPDPRPEPPQAEAPALPTAHSQLPARKAVAMIQPAKPEAPQSNRGEEAGPAPLAGFVHEPLVPAVATLENAGSFELAHAAPYVPSLPNGSTGSQESLPPAPRVEFGSSLQALDYHTRQSERGMEIREFAAPAPLIEMNLRPESGTEPAGSADVMEILMSPHPPQKASPWLGAPRGFPATPAELGQLARLDFATVGFAYSDGPVSASALAAEPPVAPETVEAQAAPPQAPIVEAPVAVEQPAVVETAPSEAPPPELVTKALPVTLHGLAAPRGKLTQTFSSAIHAATDVQIPPSASLPLRPVIVFGPAPAPPAAPAPPVAASPAPTKPVPEKTESGFRSSMVPVPQGVPVKRPVAAEVSAPKVQAPAAQTPEPRKESPAPKPREAAAAATSDAGVPSLHLDATESAWSKLSMGLKIGIAAVVIAAVSGIAYVVTRGGSKTNETPVAAQPAPAVASGVPISGGWIDDWANFARSRRHISVLSGSAKLSDYRVEFQAQIETKAIGLMFRGLNPRNYYVTKIETIKPGLEPTVALVHFAVVEGVDENRVVVPLPPAMKVRVDTIYKIRFEAIGNHFTTWIQGQKVDEWTDSRFGSGGVGFFSEREEKAAMQGTVNVVALVPKN